VVCAHCGAEKTIKYVKRERWNIKVAVISALISALGFAAMIQGIWNTYVLWKPSWALMEYYKHVGGILVLFIVFGVGALNVMRFAPGEKEEIIVWHRNGIEKRSL
jgi:phosphate starvation-inducible membrane PsiE